METNNFNDVKVNTTFQIQHRDGAVHWCSKIDNSRYIYIGQNGSHHPVDGDSFFIEKKDS